MKFLIVGPSWVGDMVMAQTLFKQLKKRYGSDTVIDVVSPSWSLGILARMSEVRNPVALDVKHGEFGFGTRKALGIKLRGEKYNRAIVMPITWKSALVPFFANIPIRSGFLGEMRFGLINDIKKLNKRTMPLMVERYIALDKQGEKVENPSLKVDKQNQQKLIKELGLDLSQEIVAFFAGSEYGPAKRWRGFAALAKLLTDSGKTVWVIGSSKEIELGEEIKSGNQNVVNLCGKTTLEDAVDLIALCGKAICNDSGLMHIAAAVGAKVIAIYGSSTPSYTPPLTDKKQIISLGLKCAPCFKKVCPLDHTDCLEKISAQMVFERMGIGYNRTKRSLE